MKWEDRFLDDDLQDEIEQLDEDMKNVQTAIYRLQDVVNDSSEGIIVESIKELETHLKALEQQKQEVEERRSKLNEYVQ
jgi:septal ring factor EnvC (AmiA/AmiB activator)